jgi:ubiquinone/menaquinone biosynthesis C-methylase UbiE
MTERPDLDRIYARRFGSAENVSRDAIWAEICRFLARWIPGDARVLDVATDSGSFIRQVHAAERWASDVRDVSRQVGDGVTFVRVDGLELSKAVPNAYFDVVFASNYLEHLRSTDDVLAQLREFRRVVSDRGVLIVLQPNIRYVGAAYWDFIDHRVALTERSLVEAAETAGFAVEQLIPRFLPYTTKSRLPHWSWLVRLYLRLPVVWRVFGKQTLLVARPTPR